MQQTNSADWSDPSAGHSGTPTLETGNEHLVLAGGSLLVLVELDRMQLRVVKLFRRRRVNCNPAGSP